jgi:hypothetical protein
MKELLKDKRVIGLLVGVVLAVLGMVLGVDVKEAVCGVPQAAPAAVVAPAQ